MPTVSRPAAAPAGAGAVSHTAHPAGETLKARSGGAAACAELTGAHLTGAHLTGANLTGANLTAPSTDSRILTGSKRWVLLLGLLSASVLGGLFDAQTVTAKEWARKMFETTSHDFGTVARGAKAEFAFVLENIYEEDIHIAGVRSSCGCTTASIADDTLKTWEKGVIRTEFNTRSFAGQKNATITVVIDKPFPAEVQLSVRGFIRTDVVFQPGSIEFGDVDAGERVSQKMEVKYAGRPDWRISRIQKPSFVDIAVQPPVVQPGNVTYHMVISLREDAPVGYVADQVVLETNDSHMTRIPFAINGRVRPSLTVSPASITMGVLRPGESITKQIVVRADEPFRILKIDCSEQGFSFKSSDAASKLHLIPVTFTAGQGIGEMECKIQIETDLKQGTQASCLATAIIKPEDEIADNTR